MRRFISWLIMIPTAVAVVVFALNNKEPIALNLWPFALVVEMELYLVLTAVLGAGVLLGGVVSWAGGGRLRAELRKQTYAGEVARRQLAAERELSFKLRADQAARKSGSESAALSAPGDDGKTIEHTPTPTGPTPSGSTYSGPLTDPLTGQLAKSQNAA